MDPGRVRSSPGCLFSYGTGGYDDACVVGCFYPNAAGCWYPNLAACSPTVISRAMGPMMQAGRNMPVPPVYAANPTHSSTLDRPACCFPSPPLPAAVSILASAPSFKPKTPNKPEAQSPSSKPEARTPNPKPRAPRPKFQTPNPKCRAPNHKPQAPNPKPTTP